ncbi:unnamed protein product [Lasius platythorax]|uniref:Uncharacterized protein n=1 Tax=Lasius platythorax TaxID=488582 RepID=A0AAV2NB30_9HYME
MLFARLSEACLSRGRHTTPPPFVTFGVINRARKVVMCESSGRFIRQRSTAATGKVGASGLDDAEIARRGGSALNRRRQQIGPPSKTHRSLRTDATRRDNVGVSDGAYY